ncbi:DUF6282 family protein [Thermomicrobium sp. 4228-Ro]|uniref:DUF6282 family protein n=1 Tax=Thermomicrobium sp. 4228-Ro TaxID=2993937 RepID=UPI002249004E|nr:DUF6282 family protein [Thermomicrobium sp. 4228-Ro]MCX2725965.1 DUF6282 family protein [Thermomicrobium sp. 4228-Ro]
MTMHPTPSERARELVRGAYDLHVHSGPDVMPRRIDDIDLARRFLEVGLAGYVIKSHYVPTAERAAVARAAVPGVQVLGSITLNRAVGGLNPLAVEIAAREGARIVWLPTVDAANERRHLEHAAPGTKLPYWARLQREMREAGFAVPPVEVLGPDGQVVPELRAVLRIIARHGLVLATGHLGRDEIVAVVKAAREEGVRHIVVTHPDFPSQALSVEDQLALAELGAYMEHCFTPLYSGKVAWETAFAHIRAVGPDRVVLSTDLGQPDNPPVEDGLALFADRLLQAGFSEDDIRTMAVRNTVRLATGRDE